MTQSHLKQSLSGISRRTLDARLPPITTRDYGEACRAANNRAEWPENLDDLPVLMTQKYLADLFGVSERKLERDRHEGHGVRFAKIGRRVVYRRVDVLTFLEQNTHQSTAEAKAKLGT